ncbi:MULTISPECIES: RNA 3'-terminal phosphate cyclase [unclassified Acinetobacter]|uniref:RNA 3'-terminal phosphate cyclase n=1 Tax=unclassified Acinetobacter TaxID=196816 RepID=UPI0035BA73A8
MKNLSKDKYLSIDGSFGEGGGQILRTALSLSMITGTPIHLYNIRAGRKKSGLLRQHLVCVQASQMISHAEVTGASLGSTEIYFRPQAVTAGTFELNIGSAGSTFLVLQTLLPALLLQNSLSTIRIQGGTHNPMAPTAEFIQQCFVPALAKMGVNMTVRLEQAGFAPIGGGKIHVEIQPWTQRLSYQVLQTGELLALNAFANCLNLDSNIAVRELITLKHKLQLNHTSQYQLDGISQGNCLYVQAEFEHHSQIFTALGEHKKPSESIANKLAKTVKQYLASDAVADEYLTDQLLLPMALGQGGRFTAQMISEHSRTQADMIMRFLDVKIAFEKKDKHDLVRVTV